MRTQHQSKSLLCSDKKLAGQKKQCQKRSIATFAAATPSLPSELWALVIHFATLCDPDPQNVSFFSSQSCELRDHRTTIETKRNLCLVSQLWYQLTHKYLYNFVWIKKSRQAAALALTLLKEESGHETTTTMAAVARSSFGQHIRHLYIETPWLERCDPADIRTILDHASALVSYSNHHSVRRCPIANTCDPCCSFEELISTLVQPNNNLRRLSWTDYNPDVSFVLYLSPMLEPIAANLEHLELTVCSDGFFSDIGLSDILHSTVTTVPTTTPRIILPTLHSLKVASDNLAFVMLSNWSFPHLTNLSVMVTDFSYSGMGFTNFFRAHGNKVLQLELGHPSSLILNHFLTESPTQPGISLDKLCPNLTGFVCPADIGWSCMHFIPHIFLPNHPTLELIGITDIDKRLSNKAILFSLTSHNDIFDCLTKQISSFLNAKAFPHLRFLRDLSFESHMMRTRCVQEQQICFWKSIVAMCQGRGVWLEDYLGVHINGGALKRAWREANGEAVQL